MDATLLKPPFPVLVIFHASISKWWNFKYLLFFTQKPGGGNHPIWRAPHIFQMGWLVQPTTNATSGGGKPGKPGLQPVRETWSGLEICGWSNRGSPNKNEWMEQTPQKMMAFVKGLTTFPKLGGALKYFLCLPRNLGKWSYLTNIFLHVGWFNHELGKGFSFSKRGTFPGSSRSFFEGVYLFVIWQVCQLMFVVRRCRLNSMMFGGISKNHTFHGCTWLQQRSGVMVCRPFR